MVKALHRGRHRGDPRRRLQPHRRGQPPRADARPSAASTTPSYYRLDARRPALLHRLHRHRQQLNPVHPSVLRLIMDSLRYWVDRVPRRRLPLRPRGGARARVLRRRPPLGVLRRDPPGPGALAGEADRRAVGRRPGRLPGRQLPGAVVGVERPLPRRDARLLARRRRRSREFASRFTGSSDLYERRRPRPVRLDQLRHRARRLHAAPTSSPTTRSTTRPTARTTATAPTTTAPGTAASRAPTDDPEVLALRARQQRNLLATLLLSQGVPMLLGGDEFGRTPARQQQRLVPGQRALLVRLGARRRQRELLAFTRRLIALRRDHAVFRRAPLPRRARGDGDGPARRLVVPPRRAAHDPARLAAGDGARLGVFLNGAELRERTPRRRAEVRRLVPDPLQRPLRGRRRSACRRVASARRWTLELSTAEPALEAGARTYAARERGRRRGALGARAAPRRRRVRSSVGC